MDPESSEHSFEIDDSTTTPLDDLTMDVPWLLDNLHKDSDMLDSIFVDLSSHNAGTDDYVGYWIHGNSFSAEVPLRPDVAQNISDVNMDHTEDDFLSENLSGQFHHYTFDPSADNSFHMSETSAYHQNQNANFARQASTPSIERRNVPRSMAPNNALENYLNFHHAPPLNIRANPLEALVDIESYANRSNKISTVQDAVWPLSSIPFSRNENCSSATPPQLMTTPRSGSAFSDIGEGHLSATPITKPVLSRRQKNLPILPAPAKIVPQHTAIVNRPGAYDTQLFGPHKAPSKRSDRRQLTEKEKENARGVKEIGSCVVCAQKRQKCDTGEICESCQKMAKNPRLEVKHICLRGGILVFRQGIPDFFDTVSRLGSLPKIIQGPWRSIAIGDRVATRGIESVLFPAKLPLILRVREYETCDLDTKLLWSKGSIPSALPSYAIDHSTLPTASQLDAWGRNLFLEHSKLPEFRPYIMDKFLFAYLNTRSSLKYHNLVDSTIRLVSLSTWLYESHPATSFDLLRNSSLHVMSVRDCRVERRLSEVARSQLLLIAAEEFEATERKILFTVDSLMRTSGCNPQDALVLGLCLRRIAMLYRMAFKRYKKFGINSEISRKIAKSKAMYEALTTAYSLVYSGSRSPYSRRWRVKDYLGAFGNDEELSALFVGVMKYDMQYCETNRDDEDDVHIKQLFLERRERDGRRR